MKRIVGAALIWSVVFGLMWINAEAQTGKKAAPPPPPPKSHMANGARAVWVYRHHPADMLANADKNTMNGSLCTVMSLSDPAGDGKVAGTLTFYRNYDYTARRYTEPHVYNLPATAVTNAGESSRVHEHVHWNATAGTSGDMNMDVRASLFKAHDNNGKSDPHRRLVVRFKFPPGTKGGFDDFCDQDPDDDVLQEEPDPPNPPVP